MEVSTLCATDGIVWDGSERVARIDSVDEVMFDAPRVDVSDESAEAVEVKCGKHTVLAELSKVLVQPCRSVLDDLRDIVCTVVIVLFDELPDHDLGCRVEHRPGGVVPSGGVGSLVPGPDHPR